MTTLFGQATETVTGTGAGNPGTIGLHVTVSAAAVLQGLWLYSPSGHSLTQLPTSIALWTTQASPSTGTLVTSQAASWSGAAGSGWVFASFSSPPSLASGTNYMAGAFRNDAVNGWFCFDDPFTWPANSGIVTAPKDVGTGQGWFTNTTTLAFPNSQDAGFNWWLDVSITPAAVTGSAGLFGEGTLSATGAFTGTASLNGEGTLSATGSVLVPAAAALFGEGTLGPTAQVLTPGAGFASLNGEGTLGGSRTVAWAGGASLNGEGALSGQATGLQLQTAGLNGQGTLGITVKLGMTAALAGAGTLSIPQVSGGLVNGVGGAATPQALPGSSQVAVAPPGSGNWQWLGTLGQVTALTYSYICPGGADKMTCTIMVPASFQSQLFYPGYQVKIVRGGHDIWHGKLDQSSYQRGQGWTLTAVGNGNRGQDFNAYYAITWPGSEPDEVLNRAIIRGLPWVNPGYNGAPFASQFWFGQGADAASQKVSDFLNLICSRGGLTWYVNSQPGGIYGGDNLQIFPLPTVPTRLLVATTPVPRTLGGYVNYIAIRYQSSADDTTTNTPAAYAYVAATNPASIAVHGQLEAFLDLSDVGTQTAGQAQGVGNFVLQVYQAASFSGPFAVSYGQLLNMGGQAVDLGCDQAGSMVKLVLADSSYGGSVEANQPVTFIVGSYSYDDMTQTAQVSPYATVDQSLSGLLSMENMTLKPITVASA